MAEHDLEGKHADLVKVLEKQLSATNAELAALEKSHHDEVESLQAVIKSLSASEASKSPTPPPAKAKGRTPKQTKTTNWANKILSRCSDE